MPSTTSARGKARGRGFHPGLVALLWLSIFSAVGCEEPGPGRAGESVADYVAPDVEETDRGRIVDNHGPRERLVVYRELPERGARLLFLAGRGATLLDGGGSAWPDFDASRVVVFDEHGVVSAVLQGSSPDGMRLEQPAFVAERDDGVLVGEPDGNGLLFRRGNPVRWVSADVGAPRSGARGRLVAARSVFDIPLRPLPEDAPLFWRYRDGQAVPVGRAESARVALLGSLVNSGWGAVGGDGEAYFASAVRPELRRYDADGRRVWTATWPSHLEVESPRFHHDGSGLSPLFTLVQQAFTVGPDARLYVLAPGRPGGESDHVLVFDEDGTWLRAGTVDRGAAIYVDGGGHVYATPAADALSRTEASLRTPFPGFDLPSLRSGRSLALDQMAGRVVVVNFWASWCAPCRREMPLLDALHAELEGRPVAFVGVNEDVVRSDAIAFLEEIGGVGYPVVEGGGRQRQRYRYRGLPYTVVLDAEGRIARAFYGFGNSIDPIEMAVRAELDALEALGAEADPMDPGSQRGRPFVAFGLPSPTN